MTTTTTTTTNFFTEEEREVLLDAMNTLHRKERNKEAWNLANMLVPAQVSLDWIAGVVWDLLLDAGWRPAWRSQPGCLYHQDDTLTVRIEDGTVVIRVYYENDYDSVVVHLNGVVVPNIGYDELSLPEPVAKVMGTLEQAINFDLLCNYAIAYLDNED